MLKFAKCCPGADYRLNVKLLNDALTEILKYLCLKKLDLYAKNYFSQCLKQSS